MEEEFVILGLKHILVIPLKGALLEQPGCHSRLFVSSTKWQVSGRRNDIIWY
ncbi:hypothetical protein [Neobacillus bataviensis]|uniref:hypothetical protein n=1 Tax=Neobacillus bataviensis TaxID=220685 RepID=UPI001645301E|nr:hypothetical protein [Neobacillus bataviensis]